VSAAAKDLGAIAAVTSRDRLLIAAAAGGGAMAEPPDKLAALVDATRVLDTLGVRHAVIGGVAVGVRSGVPRATIDTDFAVVSTADRDAIERALTAAGFRKTGAFAHSVNLRHASGEPVQLAFDPPFDAMIDRAERVAVAGVLVPIVTKEDLIAMKQRAAADPARRRSKRLRDEADVALLTGDVPDPDEGW
jgi:hypothetical protein